MKARRNCISGSSSSSSNSSSRIGATQAQGVPGGMYLVHSFSP